MAILVAIVCTDAYEHKVFLVSVLWCPVLDRVDVLLQQL